MPACAYWQLSTTDSEPGYSGVFIRTLDICSVEVIPLSYGTWLPYQGGGKEHCCAGMRFIGLATMVQDRTSASLPACLPACLGRT